MSYYDDFYHEPSEFDAQVDEFKQSLLKSVKEQFTAEMERLKKENDELKKFRQQKKKMEQEVDDLKRQVNTAKEEAIRQAKRARLSELLDGFEVEMWTPEYYYMESRKCERCDDNRKIKFKTPLGRDAEETCPCAEKIKVYHPTKNILCKISTRYGWSTIENKWIYYSLANDGEYDSAEMRSSDTDAKNLFIPSVTTFEEVEKYYYKRFYFKDYDDCYRFCMWKMEKDAGIMPQAIEAAAE